ncbi:MAG: SCO family protein [Deltaproteobacteria bacterium]|nr:SCO family protein [Deltaproteobacteria bacterium]
MKRSSFSSLYSLCLIIIGFMGLALVSCLGAPTKKNESTSKKEHEVLKTVEVSTGASIYALETPLVDQESKPIGVKIFQGSPVLISMFYGSCGYTCPLLLENLKKVDRQLEGDLQKKIRYLLVSFDDVKDTPEELKKLAEKHQLDYERFRLAHAGEGGVREIAGVLGIQYRKTPEGGFNHSSLITLLNTKGEIVAQYEGLDAPISSIAEKIKNLSDVLTK